MKTIYQAARSRTETAKATSSQRWSRMSSVTLHFMGRTTGDKSLLPSGTRVESRSTPTSSLSYVSEIPPEGGTAYLCQDTSHFFELLMWAATL